jgi:N-acetylmuramoyl-L-alanine amidase
MAIAKKYYIITIFILIVMVFIGTVGIYSYSQQTQIETVHAITFSQKKAAQQKLKNLGYYTGAIDGIIGPKSIAATKNFQRDYGLKVDGIIGPQTLKALGLNSSSQQSSNDLYLLAKCVYAEARGEPYVGQVAVAAVILNRVKNPNFPNTIYGVVYQPWAFTAVHDGQINLEPNATAYKAAQDALNGWDPTYGCIYYYNPATATSKWIFSRKKVITIGKHVFAI